MHVKDKQHNFDKRNTTAFGVNYDYGSVMHYSAKAFSMNGQETIKTLVLFFIIFFIMDESLQHIFICRLELPSVKGQL